jgi:hypothetical protein
VTHQQQKLPTHDVQKEHTHTLFLAPSGALSFLCGALLAQNQTTSTTTTVTWHSTQPCNNNQSTSMFICHYCNGCCIWKLSPSATILSQVSSIGRGDGEKNRQQQFNNWQYPWMEMAECGQCSLKWHICTLCTALRVHIRGLSNLRAHYWLCHKEDWRPPKKRVVYMQSYQ